MYFRSRVLIVKLIVLITLIYFQDVTVHRDGLIISHIS